MEHIVYQLTGFSCSDQQLKMDLGLGVRVLRVVWGRWVRVIESSRGG